MVTRLPVDLEKKKKQKIVTYETLKISNKFKQCPFKQNRACSIVMLHEWCHVQVCCPAGTFPSASPGLGEAPPQHSLREAVCSKDLPILFSTSSASLGACALAKYLFSIQVALDQDPGPSTVSLPQCFCRAGAHVACSHPRFFSCAQTRQPKALFLSSRAHSSCPAASPGLCNASASLMQQYCSSSYTHKLSQDTDVIYIISSCT